MRDPSWLSMLKAFKKQIGYTYQNIVCNIFSVNTPNLVASIQLYNPNYSRTHIRNAFGLYQDKCSNVKFFIHLSLFTKALIEGYGIC